MQHFVLLNWEARGLPLSERILPEYLKSLGYSTHAVGKWHLGFYLKEYTPEYRGFDSHVGHWTGQQDYYDHSATEEELWGLDMHRGLEPAWDAHGKYSTVFYTEEAVKIINSHGIKNNHADKDGEENPLFLYIAHTAVHSGNPYNPLPAPDETVAKFSNIKDYRRRRYAAIVHELDASVGKVVEALSENNMLDNSIIIFTTDNGGAAAGFDMNAASNWPLRGGKRSLWQGGTRGAALVWSPFFKKPGRVSDQFFHISDWLPTLISAVNRSTEGLHALDGFDSWKALSEDLPTQRKEALLNIDSKTNEAALINGDWKVNYGSFMNGTWDDWYGPSGLDPSYRYRLDLVLNSDVSRAMNTIGFSLHGKEVLSLREQARVKCEVDKSSLSGINYNTDHILGPSIPCNPLVKPCLFNLRFDPCERRNLAEIFPDKLQELLKDLEKHSISALPPTNLPMDPRSHPALWDYTWTNFGDRTFTKFDDGTCTLP
ncbi:arylsulfatase B-like isoform X2 [Ischnura elegans]|nr:arylsulfatase B-like isoform X2 [Ischnura elegans]XP_046394381.1 arylsulfatase B-like isoform X2 [Ischnura elegans]